MTRRIAATQAKRHFNELLRQVRTRGDRVVIEENGRPAAALVSLKELDSREDPRDRPGALLDCVGLFADFPEWEKIMKEVVASRRSDRPRKVRAG